MSIATDADIAICGAGPVGQALALMLVQQKIPAHRITLIDAKTAEFDELCELIDSLPTRSSRVATQVLALRPVRALPLLNPAARPLPAARKPASATTTVQPVEYQMLYKQ